MYQRRKTAFPEESAVLTEGQLLLSPNLRNEPIPQKRIIDVNLILKRVGDDRNLVIQLISLFLNDYSKHLEDLQKAMVSRNLQQIRFVLHSLNGSASLFGARHVCQSIRRVKGECRKGNEAAIYKGVTNLLIETERLVKALKDLRDFCKRNPY